MLSFQHSKSKIKLNIIIKSTNPQVAYVEGLPYPLKFL